jgi:hypothetical protein
MEKPFQTVHYLGSSNVLLIRIKRGSVYTQCLGEFDETRNEIHCVPYFGIYGGHFNSYQLLVQFCGWFLVKVYGCLVIEWDAGCNQVVHWMRHRDVYVVPPDRSIQTLHGEAGSRRPPPSVCTATCSNSYDTWEAIISAA